MVEEPFFEVLIRRWTRVTPPALSMFLHHLVLLIRAGVDIIRTLEILESQEPNRRLRYVIGQVRRRVWSTGCPISSACATFPSIFPPAVLLMMEMGELGGSFPSSVEHAAALMDAQYDLRCRIKAALNTPLVTIGVSLALVLFVVQKILPRFLTLFDGMHVKMSHITRTVVLLVHVVNSKAFVLSVVAIAGTTWLYWEALSQALMIIMISWSVTRRVFGQVLAISFCQVVSQLYDNGIPITTALELMMRTTTFAYHGQMLRRVSRVFRDGATLADAVRNVPYFPRIVEEMVYVGEETGSLTESLRSATRLLDDNTQDLMNRVVAVIDPAALILVGALMLFFMLGVFLPIYQLLQVVH